MAGRVTISVEVELGWGTHDLGSYSHLSADGAAEADALRDLLVLCDELKIPITFDVVGHLLHESCSGSHDGPHPACWWAEDPGTDAETDPLFYAPELIRAIDAADTPHEICTHTYSHVLCDEVETAVLKAELANVREVHDRIGLDQPTSIVPPRHQTPTYEALAARDYRVIRRSLPLDGPADRGAVGKFLWLFRRRHPTTTLQRSDGLVETLCTPYPSLTAQTLPIGQSPPHPALRVLPRRLRQRIHERYLRRAIDDAAATGGHVHLWTHLYNLANDAQWPPVHAGLSHLAAKRDEDAVTIDRMADLSDRDPD